MEKNTSSPKIKKRKNSQASDKSKSQEKAKKRKESKSRSKSKSKEEKEQKTLEKCGFKKVPAVKDSSEEPDKEKEYPPLPKDKEIKIIHWNINGLRPLLKTKELDKLIETEDPDIICFNETKVDYSVIEKNCFDKLKSEKYKSIWFCSEEKKGYAGTGVLTKYSAINVTKGLNNEAIQEEGRVITLEFEEFFLVCCYTPNAGEGLKRLTYRIDTWDKNFFEYIEKLKKKKDVVICGDLNVAYEDIDIYEPKGHNKTPGFTKEEKESFKGFLSSGYVDSFRELHKEEKKFSYFTKRFKANKTDNKGWRLDYFIVNSSNKFKIIESDMVDRFEYNSSDHIPIKFVFKINK